MIKELIQEGADFISDLFTPEPEPKSIREKIIKPDRDTMGYDDLETFQLQGLRQEEGEYDIDTEDRIRDTEDDYDQAMRRGMQLMKEQGQTFAAPMTAQAVKTDHLEFIKRAENSQERGLVKAQEGDLFMPFNSSEGEGPDKSMSEQEIGYGIKIQDQWLGKDKSKWPVVNGVPVDVSKGITRPQAAAMVGSELDKAYKTSASKLSTWKKMTEGEKAYWADLTYNGGTKAIKKNPIAKKAAEDGYTVEGMIETFDFIKINNKHSRGLLNRRLTMYNQASLEIAGAPIIEKYEFGKTIRVKFNADFDTDKVSKDFAKKLKASDGWLTVTKGVGVQASISKEVDDNFKFEG